MTDISADLRRAVQAAQHEQAFLDALASDLQEAEQTLFSAQSECQACGACCDFKTMDHRLFVSTGELALVLRDKPPRPPEPLRCPYQQGALCLARQHRPLGCRMFCCRSGAPQQAEATYEHWHGLIKSRHATHNIPYFYTELTEGLTIVLLSCT